MNAGAMRRALVRHLNWWQNTLVPEFSIDNGGDRADLLQITKAGFAVEYEIKVSAADWRRDLAKPKWTARPATGNRYVSRFYFVVPGKRVNDGLRLKYVPAIAPPPRLPAGVGVIVAMPDGYCHEATAARRYKVEPLPENIVRRAMDCFYYRFWRIVDELERRKPQARAA